MRTGRLRQDRRMVIVAGVIAAVLALAAVGAVAAATTLGGGTHSADPPTTGGSPGTPPTAPTSASPVPGPTVSTTTPTPSDPPDSEAPAPPPGSRTPSPPPPPPPPPPAGPGRLVRWTASGGRTVALTFDDGPSPDWTPQVLALLRQYHITATFCLIGDNVKRYPNLVRQIAADGHRLCDHTMTHDEHLKNKPDGRIRWEIAQDLAEIHQAAPGVPVRYFRAPGGNWGPNLIAMSRQLGLTPVDWTVDPRDWSRPGVAHIIQTVENQTQPGGVILEHDGGGDRSQTLTAARTYIPWLLNQGYTFDLPAT
ncbi:MAG: polysaccharide deacetylase family protein [Mycobacteriales bacterium]